MGKVYEKSWLAVNAVIFTIDTGKLKVLLNEREKEPFKGRKELPGGLLLPGENAEETLKRKLKETLGHKNIFFQQFFTFTNPKRDPRERAVSIGYIALVSHDRVGHIEDLFDIENLPALAFDHKEIIEKARNYLRNNISSLIVKQFMRSAFPLNKLQEAYEIIEGKKYDNRNFRKKMLASGVIEETDKIEKAVSHRPARLFKFKN